MKAREFIKQYVEIETYKRKMTKDVIEDVVDIIYEIITDAEMYDFIIRLEE